MPAGLEVWDAAGNQILSLTSNLVKVMGIASIGSSYTGETQTGTIIDSRFQIASHTPFFARIDGVFNSEGYDAVISIVGNTLTWSFPRPVTYNGGFMVGRPNQTFLYGIY